MEETKWRRMLHDSHEFFVSLTHFHRRALAVDVSHNPPPDCVEDFFFFFFCQKTVAILRIISSLHGCRSSLRGCLLGPIIQMWEHWRPPPPTVLFITSASSRQNACLPSPEVNRFILTCRNLSYHHDSSTCHI